MCELTPEQQKIFNQLKTGDNFFLTGDAGTGKSFVLDKYIDYLNDNQISHIVCAPTGVAALNLKDGTTLHRTFKVPIGFALEDNKKRNIIPKTLNPARVIIIDEISMCRIDVFEFVMKKIVASQRKSCQKQIIVVGDFFQLPPVVTEKDQPLLMQFFPGNLDGWCFKSEYWRNFNFKPLILKNVVRQDDVEFIKNLNLARNGDISCIDYFNQKSKSARQSVKNDDGDVLFLCNRNNEVASINAEEMAKLDAEEYKFPASAKGKVNKGDKVADELLKVCVGAKVMTLINSPGEFVNGSHGTITEIDELNEVITVKFDETGREVEIEPHTWKILQNVVRENAKGEPYVDTEEIGSYTQFPLKLAYAITIHKSQGMTFDKVALNTKTFAAGQLYVGLSRCSNIENLTVYPKIEPQRLQASKQVVEFYESLENETIDIKVPIKYADELLEYLKQLQENEMPAA